MPPRSSVKQPSRRSTRLSSVEQPPRFALPNSSDNFYGNNNVIPPARGGRPPPANEDAEDNRIFREVAESDDELQDEFIGGPGSSPSSRSAASMTRSPRKRNVKSSLNSQNNMHLSDAMGGLRFRDTQHERSITGLPPPSNEREPFAPENPPTSDGSLFMRDEEDIQDNPRAGLNNPYSARYPSLQPFQPASSSLAAKFGVAGGRTSTMSLSPVRPDTSRSFNHEGDIFRVAAIRTPTPASQASAATPPLSVLPSPPVIEQTRRSNTPEHPEPKQTNPAAPVTQQPLPDRHVDELPRQNSSRSAEQIHNSRDGAQPLGIKPTKQPSDIRDDQSADKTGDAQDVPRIGSRISNIINSHQTEPQISNNSNRVTQPRPLDKTANAERGGEPLSKNNKSQDGPNVPEQVRRAINRRNAHSPTPENTRLPPPSHQSAAEEREDAQLSPQSVSVQPWGSRQQFTIEISSPLAERIRSLGNSPQASSQRTAGDAVEQPFEQRYRSAAQRSRINPLTANGRNGPTLKEKCLYAVRHVWRQALEILGRILAPIGQLWQSTCNSMRTAWNFADWRMLFVFGLILAAIFSLLTVADNISDSGAPFPSEKRWGKGLPALPGITGALSSLYPSALLGVFGGSDTRSVISRLFESRNSHWFRLRVDEDGSVEVPQAIYHAIQEAAAKAGKSITFTDDSHSDLTNRQWEQIEKHLKEIGVITPKGKKEKGKGAEEIPKIVKHEVQDALDKWLKENNAAVDRILGSANPAKSEKEIRRLFDEYSKSLNGTHKFVNRDELAGLIQKEVRKPQAEYQKEFQILMDRVQEFEKAMAKYQAEPPKGMSEAEVRAIVKDAVAKAVSYAQLEASARAAINSHLVDHLANQVNFFGAGSGAVIDPTYTTPNWRLPKFAYKSKKWFERDGYKPQPPRIAIEPWSEEGECWCAGTEGSKSHAAGTASLSVLMSRDMVPRHLVLEHILSGATLDPGAMPREVEVWAKFEELGLQRTVESWSRGRWPAEDRVPTVLHAGFVKLGHFVYEDRNAGDGAQVFKLDDEVARMKAATNHVVVRALSNYGAEDHTCIYRVRMYGDVVERDSYDY